MSADSFGPERDIRRKDRSDPTHEDTGPNMAAPASVRREEASGGGAGVAVVGPPTGSRTELLVQLQEAYDAEGYGAVDADLLVAFHEVGHAWAYWRLGRPIRYITLRPRRRPGEPAILGRTLPPRTLITARDQSYVAMAGPACEAMYVERACQGQAALRPVEDMLDLAMDLGGGGAQGDAAVTLPGDRSESSVLAVQADLERCWDNVTLAAETLRDRHTLTHGELVEILGNG